jgi:hypothetical protein
MEIEYTNIYEQLNNLQELQDKLMEEKGLHSNIKRIWLTEDEWNYMYPGDPGDDPRYYMHFELRLKK